MGSCLKCNIHYLSREQKGMDWGDAARWGMRRAGKQQQQHKWKEIWKSSSYGGKGILTLSFLLLSILPVSENFLTHQVMSFSRNLSSNGLCLFEIINYTKYLYHGTRHTLRLDHLLLSLSRICNNFSVLCSMTRNKNKNFLNEANSWNDFSSLLTSGLSKLSVKHRPSAKWAPWVLKYVHSMFYSCGWYWETAR